METTQVLKVVLVFVLAGCVKGVTGMGLPTVAMSFLGLWMPPMQAATLLVIPSLATNVAQCRGPYLGALTARLWPGWLLIVLVTVCAPGLGGAVSVQWGRGWLGGILVMYGIWGLWRPHLPDLSLASKWISLIAGAVTGAITALTAVFVLPWVPYLQMLRLGRDEMVQALGLSFTIATISLAVRVQMSVPIEMVSSDLTIAVSGALISSLCGLKLGEILRSRLAGSAFQKALFLVFLGLGAANLIQAL